jgi:GR25 family glycosyltransferase involved in LPS biosynthesis
MNYFDHVFFINLDRRKDRLDLITEQLSKAGIVAERVSGVDGSLLNPSPKIGNGWNHKGVAGCLLSHRKVIQLARERGYKNFLVIEDDTIFDDNFKTLFENYIRQVPKDWDMLYFGGNHQKLNIDYKNGGGMAGCNINVGKCNSTLTTNMYGMSNNLFNFMLNTLPEEVEKLTEPIDVIYTRIQQSGKFNCYFLKPHLVWQDSIYSDIENKSQDLPFLRPCFPKMSLIISSCNQKSRLRYALKSALLQRYYNYEVIVADDNSTDGTIEMVEREFPGVTLSLNKHSEKDTYTLAQNWNTAASLATGSRLIFTNADCILPSIFVSAHADSNMLNNIIFGPNERTDENIEILLHEDLTPGQLMEKYCKLSKEGITKDLRHDNSAYTYNSVYSYYYPWGNNMSVPADKFFKVGGFPELREYGGEEILLSKKLAKKENLIIKSNVFTKNIHLWHPVTNRLKKPFNELEYSEYIDN